MVLSLKKKAGSRSSDYPPIFTHLTANRRRFRYLMNHYKLILKQKLLIQKGAKLELILIHLKLWQQVPKTQRLIYQVLESGILHPSSYT